MLLLPSKLNSVLSHASPHSASPLVSPKFGQHRTSKGCWESLWNTDLSNTEKQKNKEARPVRDVRGKESWRHTYRCLPRFARLQC